MKREGLPKSPTSCEKDEMAPPHSDSKSPCYCYGDTLLTFLGSCLVRLFPNLLLYHIVIHIYINLRLTFIEFEGNLVQHILLVIVVVIIIVEFNFILFFSV